MRFHPGFRTSVLCTMTAVSGVLSTGCPYRNEKIVVHRDGSIAMNVRFEGTAADMDRFDAMPSESGGWKVERAVEKKDKEEDRHILTASRDFAPGATLPASYAAEGEADADLVVQFPTTLTIETRSDGVYYTFRRVYLARPWAYAHHIEEMLLDENVKKLTEKPVEELTPDERNQVLQALLGVEAYRQAEFSRIAFENAGVEAPIEAWLLARGALLETYEAASEQLDQIFRQCLSLPDPRRTECYDAEARRLSADGYEAMLQSLRGRSAWNDTRIGAFERAFARARRFHEISGDLGGNAFEIEVTMPGELIAHNGDKFEVGGSSDAVVKWQFEGKAFLDRAHELIVVSRVVK